MPNYLKKMIRRSMEFQAHVVLRGTAASSTHLLRQDAASAPHLIQHRSARLCALPVRSRDLHHAMRRAERARALQETRAHGDTV